MIDGRFLAIWSITQARGKTTPDRARASNQMEQSGKPAAAPKLTKVLQDD